MSYERFAILVPIVVGMFALASGSTPTRPGPRPPRSLDEQLLEDLGGDPLDELEPGPSEPADRQDQPGNPRGDDSDDLGARLRRELGAAAVAEEDNPLLEVARQMREVEGRIAQHDSGGATQGLQQQIVADLEELIRQAQKQCQGGKPGSKQGSSASQPRQPPGGTQPSKNPATTSNPRTGNTDRPKSDGQQVRSVVRELWDVALPPQQREQLQQWSFDEFLPKYEVLIEQYFRQLSQKEDNR
jgi:TolA-binding protein